jgi:hypothetical protein
MWLFNNVCLTANLMTLDQMFRRDIAILQLRKKVLLQNPVSFSRFSVTNTGICVTVRFGMNFRQLESNRHVAFSGAM